MWDDATLLGAAMLGSLVLYALLGGADFGGGVWDLLASGPRAERQRELIAGSIAPIWEANHVWLILVVVILLTGFPPAFAEMATRLHAPLLALLLAIVIRGAAFAFRSAAGDRQTGTRRLSAAFALASAVAPVVLGMTIGALVSGELSGAAPPTLSLKGPWLAPFAIVTGLFALALFAFLAATYLTLDAGDDELLREDFRRRALVSGVCSGALALATFLLSGRGAPLVRMGLLQRSWSLALHALTALAALTALGALWKRRFRLARACAAVQVAAIVFGWGASQYPYLIVPSMTLESASASRATQHLLLWALAAGIVVLFPSLFLLFHIFKGPKAAKSGRIE
jgi:cytochrome d ubiquinol oxidase subunit II